MLELLKEAFFDALKMAPLLLVVYYLVEWVERSFGESIQHRIRSVAKAGPFVGAVFGSVPQCGFSVIASAMYSKRLITVGTLLAVFLSTSDEAIPVILAQPHKIFLVIPLVLTKIAIGIIGGYGADIFLRSYVRPQCHDHECEHDHKEEVIHERGCCEHEITDGSQPWQMHLHPLKHTIKVLVYLFLVSAGINYGIWRFGEVNLARLMLHNSIFQPVITGLIGLIPNCAASVAITELYLKGGISYGSAISGLCASGGLGILVLLRENRSLTDSLRILGLLFGISVLVGILIQNFYR